MGRPIRLASAARFTQHPPLPHQQAAWNWLEDQLSDGELRDFAELYRAAPPPKEPPPDPWLAPALSLISKWEGCKLSAYADVAEVWTIGYGTTQMSGRPVQKGDKITQQQANDLLREQVQNVYAPAVFRLIPKAKSYKPNQVAALTSFVYNVGIGALENSTLRRRLNGCENPFDVVREELPRWNNAGGEAVEGLSRRRADEVLVFCSGEQLTAHNVVQKVPYFSQVDNASGTGWRECFSSSCAMIAAYYGKVRSDDEYNRVRAAFGDTTSTAAQVAALRKLGLKPVFRTDGTTGLLKAELRAGRPVAVGWLHKGPARHPQGGGHWSVIIGFDETHWVVNDPYGEAALVSGGYLSVGGQSGAGLRYSYANFNPRWMVEGSGSGWCVTVRA